ncbi:sugar ABC transporter permease, partial [Acinetobacter baumannii]|nr:sugar ABC transporter permease [Acinetobacter baumannii]
MSAATAGVATGTNASGAGATQGAGRGPRRSDLGVALLFILPALFGFVVFYLYPTFRGIYFSLTRYNVLGKPHFIGFGNYTKLFADPLFWNAMKVTVEYVVLNIVFQTILAVAIGVLMQ